MTLAGCGSALQQSVNVANALGGAAVAAGTQVNADYAVAVRSCQYAPAGEVSPLPVATQRSCLDRADATYGPALTAYDSFLAVWPSFALLVHTAEAWQMMGKVPPLDKIAALLPQIVVTAEAFTVAFVALQQPKFPAVKP
jgi:hypothetical protein